MTLGEYISLLEDYPRDLEVKKGLGNPHSWRGNYTELAFEPVENTTVGQMLDEARSAVGATMEGYKGGQYLMDEGTTIHIDPYGSYTGGSTALLMLFELMLGDLD